ncbi:hypothetical protein C8R45DRAFT_192159 [Mycena sanguinolenta]|nr:hypothetical protein C8R45DRAFT_192159 [Mycena sanguinolenta]
MVDGSSVALPLVNVDSSSPFSSNSQLPRPRAVRHLALEPFFPSRPPFTTHSPPSTLFSVPTKATQRTCTGSKGGRGLAYICCLGLGLAFARLRCSCDSTFRLHRALFTRSTTLPALLCVDCGTRPARIRIRIRMAESRAASKRQRRCRSLPTSSHLLLPTSSECVCGSSVVASAPTPRLGFLKRRWRRALSSPQAPLCAQHAHDGPPHRLHSPPTPPTTPLLQLRKRNSAALLPSSFTAREPAARVPLRDSGGNGHRALCFVRAMLSRPTAPSPVTCAALQLFIRSSPPPLPPPLLAPSTTPTIPHRDRCAYWLSLSVCPREPSSLPVDHLALEVYDDARTALLRFPRTGCKAGRRDAAHCCAPAGSSSYSSPWSTPCFLCAILGPQVTLALSHLSRSRVPLSTSSPYKSLVDVRTQSPKTL